MSQKKNARYIQKQTGAKYMACLQWAKILQDENLISKEKKPGVSWQDALMAALQKRFDVRVKGPETEEPDFLDELIAESEAKSPGFAQKVERLSQRRAEKRDTREVEVIVRRRKAKS